MKFTLKRGIALLSAVLLITLAFAGCNTPETETPPENVTIKVGATAVPHAEILKATQPLLLEKGINLEIVEFVDYIQPNVALDSGELDANYFQHLPYLEDFNAQHNMSLYSAANIHYEPFGIFPGKTASLDELADGAKVAVPNDTTNEARALLLLQEAGLISIKEGVGLNATKLDIINNPKNLDIVELEAAQIPRSLPDVDIAAINGNYALEAGLRADSDALYVESSGSLAASTYANILVVKTQADADRPEIKALIEVLTSDAIKDYINSTYNGAVLPVS